MHIEVKRKLIEEKMYKLNERKREKFRDFLVSNFSDEDLQDLTHQQADIMLAFLANI
jgi:hypothetical protein